MARPKKMRQVGFHPCIHEMSPDGQEIREKVVLKLDEVESLRLMDLENMDQKSCAEEMGISRSTFQRIYKSAKSKVADAIVNGKKIKIDDPNQSHHCCRKEGNMCHHGKEVK